MYLLIDGKNLIYRAFYGMPELTRKADGFPTGAIYGWLRAMWRLADQYPAAVATEVFWDAGHAARADLAADYKAHRKPIPQPMKQQVPIIERLTNMMGIASWREEGNEADDLIAGRAFALAEQGHEVLIVSADKDFAQCVGERINILNPPPTVNPKEPWRRLDAAGVMEKFGVEPRQIADYLALMGDSSDNVKGLEGVGPKTAAEWLRLYRDIDGIIANSGRLSPKSKQNLVYEAQEQLKINRQITTLHPRVLPQGLCTAGRLDVAALVRELTELDMRSSADEASKRYVDVRA